MLIFRKLLRDLWFTRSRALTMVVSIAVGLVGFNTLVGAYSILTREIVRNYMDSKPASIILEMDDVDKETLAWIKNRPDIAAATRRTQVRGRFSTKNSDEKRRALFFVVDDFRDMGVAKIFPESGAWPPEPGTLTIERSAVDVVGGGIGTTLLVDLPGLSTEEIRVSGIAHEPALAPAKTEQALYAYLSQKELARLGFAVAFNELRVIPTGRQDFPSLEQKARELERALRREKGVTVTALRVPPPSQHPHQTQMTAVLSLFVIFAGCILVLSSLLTASLLSTMMARQVREMGILKTLGARRRELLLSYGLLVVAIALAAFFLAFFPTEIGVKLCVQAITGLLNFDVADANQGTLARLLSVSVALLVPLLVSLPALIRGTGLPVMKALADYGVARDSFGDDRLEKWVAKWGYGGQFSAYALRNILRRRGRFVLSLTLLGTSGAIFLAAFNTAQSWDVLTRRLYTSHHYDLEVGFSRPIEGEELAKTLQKSSQIARVETWLTERTAPGTGHRLPIERTYPDGGHGSFSLVAAPPGSDMITFDVNEGRLLSPTATGEVVVNQMVPGAEKIRVGQNLTLSVAGKDQTLRVVGKIEEVGTGAVAYVSRATFEQLVPPAHRNYSLRLKKEAGTSLEDLTATTSRILDQARAPVTHVMPLAVFENAVAGHFEILVNCLLALAVLTALVGTLGLTSALSSNVSESTRELAVLRAVGASGQQIRRLVVVESLLVSGFSFVLAAALGVALTFVVGNVIGMMSFRIPLPFAPQSLAFSLLFFALLLLGAFASLLPARRAANLTVAAALRVL